MSVQRSGGTRQSQKERDARLTGALKALAAYVRDQAFDVCTVRAGGVVDRWKSPRLLRLLNEAEELLPAAASRVRDWHPIRTAPKARPGEPPLEIEAILPDEPRREQTVKWINEAWVTDAGKAVRPVFWRRCAE
jgi:hypothetical protein